MEDIEHAIGVMLDFGGIEEAGGKLRFTSNMDIGQNNSGQDQENTLYGMYLRERAKGK